MASSTGSSSQMPFNLSRYIKAGWLRHGVDHLNSSSNSSSATEKSLPQSNQPKFQSKDSLYAKRHTCLFDQVSGSIKTTTSEKYVEDTFYFIIALGFCF